MPAPAEPRPETDHTTAPSARSDVDETSPGGSAAASGVSSVSGFGPPVAAGEVGTLGPYRLVKELGKGGMGAVYAAVDTRLERPLALKVMLPECAADAAAKERFLREARAAARVKHDHVVTVYEADERQGVPYIAMEFLEGLPLDAYLKKKGSPSVAQVVRIATETAAGLAAAHRIGLVHRDIKPANLWLEAPHGRVKVLDFGLARPVDAEFEVTKSGAVVGTPAYMSPEQARGERVDHRTDLFSFGTLLYRLCTGKLPFHGPTTMAVLMALGTEDPTPVRDLNPDVPESLAALIHQLLSKPTGARPESAAEVMGRLQAVARELAAPRPAAEVSTSQPQVMRPQVVYVATPVTAAEGNPFADLDAPDTERTSLEPSEESATAPMPARRKPGRWLWPAAGFAALALAVGGVVIVIKNKDGSETKIEVPDGATVTVKDKGGKTLAQVGAGKKNPAEVDPDRKAAEYALSVGGEVLVNGEKRPIRAAAELPKEPFRLTQVGINGNQARGVTDAGLAAFDGCKNLTHLMLHLLPVTDAGLGHFKGCTGLVHLNVSHTRVTDAGLAHFRGCGGLKDLILSHTRVTDVGLAHFKECKGLTSLSLQGTQVTDVGLAHFKECRGLTFLNVPNTAVTDAGLAHLGELKGLTSLNVKQTKVTAKGLEAFHAALPGCKIVHDGGTIEPVDVDRAAAEWAVGLGGTVRVDGEVTVRRAAADLPKDRFTLTHLNLHGTLVSDAGLAHLRDLKGLTQLRLGGTKVSNEGLEHLKGLKRLTLLHLDGTKVSNEGLEHLKELKSLATLSLHGTPVSGAGLEHLKSLKGLTYLALSGPKVSDAELAHLREFKDLTRLDLGGTKVSDAGLEHLKELKGLTYLDVRKTKVTVKGLEDFHAAVPGCKIEHDGGTIEPKK